MAILFATALHPAFLVLCFPVMRERANLEMVLAPLLAVWLLGLRHGLVILLVNSISTGAVFANLTGAGPREGIFKSLVAIVVASMLCIVLFGIKRYLEQGKAMEAEIEKLREPNL
jgi:riboflavin transporter FmnP